LIEKTRNTDVKKVYHDKNDELGAVDPVIETREISLVELELRIEVIYKGRVCGSVSPD
jgi:hypothetical protein